MQDKQEQNMDTLSINNSSKRVKKCREQLKINFLKSERYGKKKVSIHNNTYLKQMNNEYEIDDDLSSVKLYQNAN